MKCGCPKCGILITSIKKTKSYESFVEEAKNIHGKLYDYSNIVFTNRKDKIKLECKIHGEFEQSVMAHLRGQGCPKCGIIKRTENMKYTNEEFIEIAKYVHNNTYRYDLANYTDSQSKVTIICDVHGIFLQTPSIHLQGAGCIKCGIEKSRNSKIKTQEQFIEQCNIVHSSKYDYSESNYIGNDNHVTIICRTHGKFSQRASNHLQGRGCQKCPQSKQYSIPQLEWLSCLQNEIGLKIQHIENIGEHKIKNSLYKADGYHELSNTIFEFHGCYYHGCPGCFPKRHEINKVTKKTYNDLYVKTLAKMDHCIKENYGYIEMWDCDWNELKDNKQKMRSYASNMKNEFKHYIDLSDNVPNVINHTLIK